tara:strand:- start:750 stop:983 length:234 start_codon:yes stop_codon:yes gene_type:complete
MSDLNASEIARPAASSEPRLIRIPEEILSTDLASLSLLTPKILWAFNDGMLLKILMGMFIILLDNSELRIPGIQHPC